ncbi:Protein-tyrosine phosphatase, SIW14-like domain-containing protein [Rozella allomycis CSF55]|uniref:Protein-tyrosine phosphatase, SIW14-like domain-containing protein n=1 Tax=Rozella allomycis (strain CSF55) TaxID=988480 RepID=A0A075B4Y9_ROZAC|nr:Protein-tyrosine phosphatase, SIW14-like domain-containing protein [Rozella allomycis CSF55]|eukprot:EPZ36581.1 Protein-tyrosine phosphatase, SIW14-like domain-containing protein [Rozella allomycis CSF55]
MVNLEEKRVEFIQDLISACSKAAGACAVRIIKFHRHMVCSQRATEQGIGCWAQCRASAELLKCTMELIAVKDPLLDELRPIVYKALQRSADYCIKIIHSDIYVQIVIPKTTKGYKIFSLPVNWKQGKDGKRSICEEPFVEIDRNDITKALSIILDTENLPILVHCNKGKHRVGCVVAALRKIHGWSLTSIFDEYERFAGAKVRIADLEFIELFVPNLTSLTH